MRSRSQGIGVDAQDFCGPVLFLDPPLGFRKGLKDFVSQAQVVTRGFDDTIMLTDSGHLAEEPFFLAGEAPAGLRAGNSLVIRRVN